MNEQSIFKFRDVSIASFHATKVFHTIEGGAIITNNDSVAEICRTLRNFGKKDHQKFLLEGTNGKNSELHAAFGLCNLPKVKQLIKKRKNLSILYKEMLKDTPLYFPESDIYVQYNYSFSPVLFESSEKMLLVKQKLEKKYSNNALFLSCS